MTSMAFFFGVLPLAIATGPGAGAMKAIGTAVCGGMLSATFIDLIFIPLFFVVVSRLFKRKGQNNDINEQSHNEQNSVNDMNNKLEKQPGDNLI